MLKHFFRVFDYVFRLFARAHRPDFGTSLLSESYWMRVPKTQQRKKKEKKLEEVTPDSRIQRTPLCVCTYIYACVRMFRKQVRTTPMHSCWSLSRRHDFLVSLFSLFGFVTPKTRIGNAPVALFETISVGAARHGRGTKKLK